MKFSSQRFEVSEDVAAALIRYGDYLRANLPARFHLVNYRRDFIDATGGACVLHQFEGRMDDRRKYGVLVPSGLGEVVEDPEGAARDTLVAAEREAKKVLASVA